MSAFRAHRTFVRTVAVILLGVYLPACHSWQVQQGPPAETLASPDQISARITLHNGSRVAMDEIGVVGDSVVGRLGRFRPGVRVRTAVALEDIQQVELRRLDGVETMFVVLGVGLTVLLIAGAAYASSDWWDTGDEDLESCPLVYSWDGEDWRLDSGTFAGAFTRAAARTDVDVLLHAVPTDGVLHLKLANELNETDYVDALSLLVADHDAGVTVVPDAMGRLHAIAEPLAPLRATDFRGRDVLDRVRAADDMHWESLPTGLDSAGAEDIRDGIELTFTRPAGTDRSTLVIDGRNTPWASFMLAELIGAHGYATEAWYDSLATQPRLLQQLSAIMAHTAFLEVSVLTRNGWTSQGYVWPVGPELGKRQALAIDIADVEADTLVVRLASAPSFWLVDRVVLDVTPPRPIEVREVRAARALDRVRGDVRGLLDAVDGSEYVLEPGDHAVLDFEVPPPSTGMARSYLVKSTGWYRVHTDQSGTPRTEWLRRILADRDQASRVAVGRLNDGLRALSLVR